MKMGMKTEIVKLSLAVNIGRDHIQGPTYAVATLIEYGDYECPYCGQAYTIIKDIQKHLGNKLCFGFRIFHSLKFTHIRSSMLKQPKLLRHRISFGICMITSALSMMMSIWRK